MNYRAISNPMLNSVPRTIPNIDSDTLYNLVFDTKAEIPQPTKTLKTKDKREHFEDDADSTSETSGIWDTMNKLNTKYQNALFIGLCLIILLIFVYLIFSGCSKGPQRSDPSMNYLYPSFGHDFRAVFVRD
jgi:hypothetical protein